MERSGTAVPQGLSPSFLRSLYGTAEAVPSQILVIRRSCSYERRTTVRESAALTTHSRVGFGELQFVQSPVSSQLLHELFVRANIADGAIFKHRDAVGAAHRRKSMRDYQYSTPADQILQSR